MATPTHTKLRTLVPLYEADANDRTLCQDVGRFAALLRGVLRLADELGLDGLGPGNLKRANGGGTEDVDGTSAWAVGEDTGENCARTEMKCVYECHIKPEGARRVRTSLVWCKHSR
jgi:hypothetical protein